MESEKINTTEISIEDINCTLKDIEKILALISDLRDRMELSSLGATLTQMTVSPEMLTQVKKRLGELSQKYNL